MLLSSARAVLFQQSHGLEPFHHFPQSIRSRSQNLIISNLKTSERVTFTTYLRRHHAFRGSLTIATHLCTPRPSPPPLILIQVQRHLSHILEPTRPIQRVSQLASIDMASQPRGVRQGKSPSYELGLGPFQVRECLGNKVASTKFAAGTRLRKGCSWATSDSSRQHRCASLPFTG